MSDKRMWPEEERALAHKLLIRKQRAEPRASQLAASPHSPPVTAGAQSNLEHTIQPRRQVVPRCSRGAPPDTSGLDQRPEVANLSTLSQRLGARPRRRLLEPPSKGPSLNRTCFSLFSLRSLGLGVTRTWRKWAVSGRRPTGRICARALRAFAIGALGDRLRAEFANERRLGEGNPDWRVAQGERERERERDEPLNGLACARLVLSQPLERWPRKLDANQSEPKRARPG